MVMLVTDNSDDGDGGSRDDGSNYGGDNSGSAFDGSGDGDYNGGGNSDGGVMALWMIVMVAIW